MTLLRFLPRRLSWAIGFLALFGLFSPQEGKAQISGYLDGLTEMADVIMPVMEQLRNENMGLLDGCDYEDYLAMMQLGIEGWDWVQELRTEDRDGGSRGLPTTDYITMVLRAGASEATRRSAVAEAKNLMYQLEQVCNAVVQEDEVNRMLDIVEARSSGIGEEIAGFVRSMKDLYEDIDNEQYPGDLRERITSEHSELYATSTPGPGGPEAGTHQDTLWAAVNESIGETVGAADEYADAVEVIYEQIEELRGELVHLAEPDEDEGWVCPEDAGYPSASEVDEYDEETGRPICGPLTPERAKQVLAQVEVLKLELEAIRMDAEARGLEVDAVRLMSDNQQRQLSQTANLRFRMGGF